MSISYEELTIPILKERKYDIHEAAEILGVSVFWLRARTGENTPYERIPHYKIGTRIFFSERMLAEILEKHLYVK